MSKEHKKGNREAKKPKAVKVAVPETTAIKGSVAAIPAAKSKR